MEEPSATDDSTDANNPPEANDETVEKEDDSPEEGHGDVVPPTITLSTSSSIHLTPELLSRRHSTAIKEMDMRHSWLSELDVDNIKFMSSAQFVALCNHFQKFIEEELVKSESALPRVGGEFKMLFSHFRATFASGQRMRSKVFEERSLKRMVSTEGMVFEKRMRDKDEQIRGMAERMEEAMMMAEERAKEVATVRREFSEYRAEVELGKETAQVEVDPLTFLNPASLAEEDDANKMKIMELELTIEELEEELTFGKEREAIYVRKLEQGDKERSQLQKELFGVKSELQKQVAIREKAEGEVAKMTEKLERIDVTVRQQAERIEKLEKELEVQTNLSKSLYKDVKRIQRESDKKTSELDKERRNVNIRDDRIQLINSQKEVLEIEIEESQAEISSLKSEKASLTKTKMDLSRRVAQLEGNAVELEGKVDTLSEASRTQLKKIDVLEKEHDDSELKMKDLTKQRDDLKENVHRAEHVATKLRHLIRCMEESTCTLNREMDNFKRELERANLLVIRERKEKQRLASEIIHLGKEMQELKEENKTQSLKYEQSEKMVAKLNGELADSAAKYKTVAEDNRFYRTAAAESRRLIDQQSQQQAMLQMTVHHLESCNQDLDDQLKHTTVDLKNASEELRQARETSKQWARKFDTQSIKLSHTEDREHALLRKVAELDKDAHVLERKMKNLLEEKESLVTRVRERDEEISDNKEKIRQLEHEASLADKAINARIEDIRLLKLQLSEMTRGRYLMEGEVARFMETRQELTEVCRELQNHQSMTKGLEGEMQRPVNLHRWRILEGTDPDRATLVAKTHTLQRELVKKNADLEAKERALAEQDAELQRLRSSLAFAPKTGPGARQDFELRRELRARADRLRGLTAENSMMEGIIGKYRTEVTALKDELRKMKMKEFKKKVKAKKGEVKV